MEREGRECRRERAGSKGMKSRGRKTMKIKTEIKTEIKKEQESVK